MIRVASVGDVHLGEDARGRLRPAFATIADRADLVLLAGDLTRHGTASEATVVAEELGGLDVPVIAVLGNHDHHSDAVDEVTEILTAASITVLDGDAVVLRVRDQRVGIAGVKGFGGGFASACATPFGERAMKDFVQPAIDAAELLHSALGSLDCDFRIALTHYSPTRETLGREPYEIYPFLGSYLLGEAIDATGTDLALHGHAHFGSERGTTPGGVQVRNVAQPVIDSAVAIYRLGSARETVQRTAGGDEHRC